MHQIASVLDSINEQHGTTFLLIDRYATGEQGAFSIIDENGSRFVLKWSPDRAKVAAFRRASYITDHLRKNDYPAPEYILIGSEATGAYAVQRALPGQSLPHLTRQLIERFLTLNMRQQGAAAFEQSRWPAVVVDPVLKGGDGFCLLEPMRDYSSVTEDLLSAIQEQANQHAHCDFHSRHDVVHFDCTPANVLSNECTLTGIVDWEAPTGGKVRECNFAEKPQQLAGAKSQAAVRGEPTE